MFFLVLLTSVFSSEYLVCLLTRAMSLLLLGPTDMTKGENLTKTNATSKIKAPLFTGTFYLESSDNFEAYLTELGVGYILRQLALLALPIVTIDR